MLELFAEMNALTEQMFNKNITKIYILKKDKENVIACLLNV